MISIYDTGMFELSVIYGGHYIRNPKNFISCFLKYPSVRRCCQSIVAVYKKVGTWEECEGDFSEWANRQNTDKKQLLADTMKIIYSITK